MRPRLLFARRSRSFTLAAWRVAAAALLLVGLAAPAGLPVQAATLPHVLAAPQGCSTVVTNTADAGAGSLRAAVACAATGQTVTFNAGLAGQTIGLTTGVITVSVPLTIDGSGAPGVMVDGGNASGIFSISAAGPVTLTALILQHGYAALGGAVYAGVSAPLVLSQVNVLSNTATSHGGGVYATAPITVTGGRFQANACTDTNCQGGGLFTGSTLVVSGTEFISNTGLSLGGGVFATGMVKLTNGRFQGNACATVDFCTGGGLFANGSLTSSGTEFITNTSGNGGGGLYVVGASVLTSTNFISNTGLGEGGGLYALGALKLRGGRVQGNAGANGGGLYADSTVALTDTDIISNTATGFGGGVFAHGTVALANAAFEGNSGGDGGGLFTDAPVVLTGSQFISNTSLNNGGGLYVISPLVVSETAFISNTSVGLGGGVFATGLVTLTNGLFQGNGCTASYCVGGGLYANGLLLLTGTEFISNTSQSDGGGVLAADIALLTNGRFQGNTCTGATCRGGGLNVADLLVVTGTEFIDNTSVGKGGAVSASSTTALTTGRFQGNACTAAGCQGGGLYVAGVLVVTGTEFLTNTSAGSGGGLYANGTAVPGYWDGARLTNVLLQDNSCLDPSCKGGGLYAADTLVLTGVDFVGNISWGGRGGGAFAFSTLTMTDTDFIANTSLTGAGGAEAAGEVTFITQGRFQENTCTGSVCSGGGLTVVSVVATVTGTEFISNTSQLSGGGVYSPGSVTVVNGVFQGNACNAASCMGGGLQVNNMLILTGTQFIANASIAGGGGVMVAGDGALTNAVFQGNTCTGVTCAGGGVLVSWSTTILRSSFDHNQAAGSGGAVAAISGANLTLANVTLATNNATLFGGAVYVTGTAQAQLLNVTLFLNYALSSGGGLYAAPSATMGVTNTLIQGNAFTSCAGQVDVGTHNLEYKGADCAAVGPTAGFTSAPSNQEALALNAPGTTWTSALLPGSAARDAGDAATCAGPEVNNLDQRGVTRPIDGDAVLGAVCDIGAYEAPACVPVVTSLLDPGDGSLRAAVACASTQAGSTVTFDSSLAGGTIYLNLGQISLTQPITIDGSGAPGVTVDAGGTNRVFDINAAGTVTLTSLVLQHGFMSEPGGAAIYAATPLVLSQVQLLTNTVTGDASHGGAVYAADALVISGTVLQGNTSVADGGAVYALGAVTLTNNWFQGNACTDVGCLGGAFWGAGASRVASSAFTDNQAGLGGAVGLTGTAALTLTNVTLSGNTATTGGGLYMGGEAGARLLNVSVVSNTAASGGGLFGAVAATLGVTNTLFSGNSGGSCAGQLDAGTHNLEWPGTTCATAGPAAGFTSADLLLGPLAFNGPGATPTHALLMDSPARDAGLAAVCGGLEVNNRDQRGAVRPFDGDRVAGAVCDIGAYEAQDAAPDLLVYLPLAVR